MNRECRQTHTGNALEHSPLRHDHAVILREWDLRRRPVQGIVGVGLVANGHVARCHALDDLILGRLAGVLVGVPGWREGLPVAQVSFVAFVADIA